MPEISEILLSGILGSNVSLDQIRTDLELAEELPGYGIQVAWESERPELLSIKENVSPLDGSTPRSPSSGSYTHLSPHPPPLP